MKFIRISTLLFFCAVSFAVVADTLDQLMLKSGLTQQLAAIENNINDGLNQGGQELPDDTLAALTNIMKKHFAADKLTSEIRAVLKQRLSSKDIKEALTWYDSDLGQRLVTLEIAATSTEQQLQQQQHIPKLLENADRFSLIRELDAATGASKANLAMVASMQKTMMYAVLGQNMTQAEIDQLINLTQASMQAELEMLVIGGLLYTYRDVNDADIRRYKTFAQTTAGQNFHQAVSDAMIRTMENTGRDVGAEIAKYLQKNN